MKYVYYDTRNISGTETQFFHESRTKATNKEYQTNMELDAQFTRDFTINKIIVHIPPSLVSSTTAKDKTLDDTFQTLLDEGVIEVQIGTGPVLYFPLALALEPTKIEGDVEYTLATSADGSYAILNIKGHGGLDVDITVPARTDFKFFIKTSTSVTLNNIKVFLVGEHPR